MNECECECCLGMRMQACYTSNDAQRTRQDCIMWTRSITLRHDTRSRSFLPLSITLSAGGVQAERGEGSATGEETPLCQQGKRHAHSCLINTSFKDHKTYSAPLNPLFLYNGLGLGLRFGSITHKRACYFILL